MMIDLVTKEDLQRLRLQLLNDMTRIFSDLQIEKENSGWIKSKEVRKVLGISPGTLVTYRKNGTLKCRKVGGHYHYDYESIKAIIDKKN